MRWLLSTLLASSPRVRVRPCELFGPHGQPQLAEEEYMALAGALSETCFKMYSQTATGLSPEFVQFQSGRDLVTPRTAC